MISLEVAGSLGNLIISSGLITVFLISTFLSIFRTSLTETGGCFSKLVEIFAAFGIEGNLLVSKSSASFFTGVASCDLEEIQTDGLICAFLAPVSSVLAAI